jgi:hypothetical protein
MKAEQPILSIASIQDSQTNGVDFASCNKYTVEILLEKEADNLPKDVNPLHKEVHLSEEDFQKVFNTDYKSFSALPQWKKQQLKKNVGLF